MTKDYFAEQFLQSVDTVVKQRLTEISYDTTKICTIVDDSDSKNGHYVVTDGSIRFDAYSESDKYRNEDIVRVSVVNGDWKQRKFIEGKYTDKDAQTPISYVSPLGTVLSVGENLVKENKTTGIVANGAVSEVYIGNIDLTEEESINSLFDTLAVSANFQSLLSEYDVRTGKYGLRIEVIIQVSEDDSEIPTFGIYEGILDSTEMFGDPYSFSIFSKQEKKFNISYIGKILGIRMYLWQDNNFTYQVGAKTERVPVPENISNYTNINIKDINITMGFDVTKIPDNEVKIYTGAPAGYINTDSTDITNRKEISLLWCNKDENHKYLGFSDGYYGKVSFDGGVSQEEYDEIKYLELVETDNRLKRQIGQAPTDEVGLSIAADLSDISTLSIKVKTYLEALRKGFARYRTDTSGAGFPEDSFGKLSSYPEHIDVIIKDYKTIFDTYYKYSTSVLAATGKIIDIQKTEKIEDKGQFTIQSITSSEESKRKDYLFFDGLIPNIIKESKTLLESLGKDISEFHAAWNGTHVNHKSAIEKAIKDLEDILKQIQDVYGKYDVKDLDILLTTRYEAIAEYGYRINKVWKSLKPAEGEDIDWDAISNIEFFGKTYTIPNLADKTTVSITVMSLDDFKNKYGDTGRFAELNNYLNKCVFAKEFESQDYSDFDNKYCIYWYRSIPGLSERDRFMGKGWQPFKVYANPDAPADKLIELKNFGLPAQDERRPDFYLPKINYNQYDKDGLLVRGNTINPFMDGKLKYEKYAVVIFYNHEMFKSNILEFTNDESLIDENTANANGIFEIIHGENSLDNYQMYGVDNYLKKASEAQVVRKLDIQYNGVGEEADALKGAKIYWYVPNNNTSMINYNLEDLMDFENDSAEDVLLKKSTIKKYFDQIVITEEEKIQTFKVIDIENYLVTTAGGKTSLKLEFVDNTKTPVVFNNMKSKIIGQKLNEDNEVILEANLIIQKSNIIKFNRNKVFKLVETKDYSTKKKYATYVNPFTEAEETITYPKEGDSKNITLQVPKESYEITGIVIQVKVDENDVELILGPELFSEKASSLTLIRELTENEIRSSIANITNSTLLNTIVDKLKNRKIFKKSNGGGGVAELKEPFEYKIIGKRIKVKTILDPLILNLEDFNSNEKITLEKKLSDLNPVYDYEVTYTSNNKQKTVTIKREEFEEENGTLRIKDEDSLATEIAPPYSRTGYICFYREINVSDDRNISGKDFTYRIKSYYSPIFNNNTIMCRIVTANNLEYTMNLPISFNSYGTSGTDYSLMVVPVGTQSAVMDNDELELKIALYDASGQLLNLYSDSYDRDIMSDKIQSDGYNTKITWEHDQYAPHDAFEIIPEKTNNSIIGCKINRKAGKEGFYGVLKVSTEVSYKTQLTEGEEEIPKTSTNTTEIVAYYPVPCCPQNFTDTYYYAAVPSFIVYSGDGNNPQYYKDPCEIYSSDTGKKIDLTWDILHYIKINSKFLLVKINNNGYALYDNLTKYAANTASSETIDTNKFNFAYCPVLTEVNGLKPCNMYVNTDYNNNINCYSIIVAKSGSKIYWVQPLYPMQNRYSIPMLNSWDGSLTIDKKNGTILSTVVGAGKKTANNTFEGVLMGEIQQDNEIPLMGLYGFSQGQQSFGFKTDGTAFIGKSGGGRIEFDGNYGTIKSSSYDQAGASGTLIDLDDGFISILGNEITIKNKDGIDETVRHGEVFISNGIVRDKNYFQSIDTDQPYFYINSKGSRLINIGSMSRSNEDYNERPDLGYYFKSRNYKKAVYDKDNNLAEDGEGEGVLFDLDTGTLDAFNLVIISRNIFIDSRKDATTYFQIKDIDGNILFNAGHIIEKDEDDKDIIKGNFYLASNNFSSDQKTGTKIDLSNGKIESYNFSIEASVAEDKYAGSSLKINSETKNFSFSMNLVENGNAGSTLLEISPLNFYLQSKDYSWSEENRQFFKDSEGIVKINTEKDNLFIRNSPYPGRGKNIGSLPKGTIVRYYGYADTSKPNNSGSGTGIRWYRISSTGGKDDYDGQWIYGGLVTIVEGNSPVSIAVQEVQGAKIDIFNREIILGNGFNQVIIESKENTNYPLQIGPIIPTQSFTIDKNGEQTITTVPRRAFMIHWDGSIYGGTTFAWSINADGVANFNALSSSGGTFDGPSITRGEISSSELESPEEEGANGAITLNGGVLNRVTIDSDSAFKSGTIGIPNGEQVLIQNSLIKNCQFDINENVSLNLNEGDMSNYDISESTITNSNIIFENPTQTGPDTTEASISGEDWKIERQKFVVNDFDLLKLSESEVLSEVNFEHSDNPPASYDLKYIAEFTQTTEEAYLPDGTPLQDAEGNPIQIITGITPVYKYIKINNIFTDRKYLSVNG